MYKISGFFSIVAGICMHAFFAMAGDSVIDAVCPGGKQYQITGNNPVPDCYCPEGYEQELSLTGGSETFGKCVLTATAPSTPAPVTDTSDYGSCNTLATVGCSFPASLLNDSDLMACFDAADTDSLTLDVDDTVIAWDNKVDGVTDGATLNASVQPLYNATEHNGHPALIFSNDAINFPIEIISGVFDYTFFIVTKPYSIPSNRVYLFDTDNLGGSGKLKLQHQTNMGLRSGPGADYFGPAVLGEQKQSWVLDSGALEAKLYIDGSLLGTAFYTPTGISGNNTAIGADDDSAGFHYDGSISEFIIFNRVLTDIERTDMEAYLSCKWD